MLFDHMPPPREPEAAAATGAEPEPEPKRARVAAPPQPPGGDEVAAALARLTQHAQSSSGAKWVRVVTLTTQLLSGGTLERKHNKGGYALLEALLCDSARVTAPESRLECSALVQAACDTEGVFNAKQRAGLEVWAVTGVTCNSLFTDDNYAFNAAVAQVKAAWSDLPDFQPMAAADSAKAVESVELPADVSPEEAAEAAALAAKMAAAERDAAAAEWTLLDARRDGLVLCVETAHGMYRWPWAHSMVDSLLDHVNALAAAKLSPEQRARLAKTHEAVRHARGRRRAGGGDGGDLTSYERGQARFANAEISIRKQVGASGADGRGESCAHRLTL
jgi:hypothetical protein